MNNLIWVFFILITCQAVFPFLNNPKINREVRLQSSHVVPIAIFYSNIALIIGYALLMGAVLLIIPEDFPNARNKSVNFDELELKMYIGGHIIAIASPLLDRAKKYYRDRDEVRETEFFNLENKFAIICLLFSLSMAIFTAYNIPFENFNSEPWKHSCV